MEFISQYVIPFKGFDYTPGSVICTLADCGINGHRQYLLEPGPLSIPHTVRVFGLLPDDLEVKAKSSSGPEGVVTIGKIKKGIRDLVKHFPGPDALAIRTEVKPGSHYYQLNPNHYDMTRAWVAELGNFLGKQLYVDKVVHSKTYRHRLGIVSVYETKITNYDDADKQYCTACIELDPYGNLWEMRTDLDPGESLVWSKTDRRLFHGSRPVESPYFG